MCIPRGVLSTVIGWGLSCKDTDQRIYILDPSDQCLNSKENDRWLVYTSCLTFSLSPADRRVTGGHRVRWSHARGGSVTARARSPEPHRRPT